MAICPRRRWTQSSDHAAAYRDRFVLGDLVHRLKFRKMKARFTPVCFLFLPERIGAFASIDLFFFYAFHELALIPTFLLIGIWGSGNRQTAAWKITIYLALGSFILLLGLILLYRSLPEASRSFDFARFTNRGGRGANQRRGTTPNIFAVADRIRNSDFAFSFSHVGARSVCLRACAGRNAPRRRAEKIRPLRLAAFGDSVVARGRAVLEQTSYRPFAWQYHLRRTRHDRAETARLDAGLFQRHAHGLHFPRDRQCEYSRGSTAPPF